jgi:hypothetical protein
VLPSSSNTERRLLLEGVMPQRHSGTDLRPRISPRQTDQHVEWSAS